MNTALLNRLNTAKSVLKTFNDFQRVVDDVPALRELKDQLSAKIATANELLKELEKDTSAHTATKRRVANEVFRKGAALGASLSTLARKKKDDVLLAAAANSISALKAGKTNEVLARLQNLQKSLVENQTELQGYKVTEEDINDFVSKVAEFEANMDAPRLARDGRTVQNQTFSACIGELSGIVRTDLANVVSGIQEKHPDFYSAFNQSAKIVRVVTAFRSAKRKPSPKKVEQKKVAPPPPPSGPDDKENLGDTGGSPFNR